MSSSSTPSISPALSSSPPLPLSSPLSPSPSTSLSTTSCQSSQLLRWKLKTTILAVALVLVAFTLVQETVVLTKGQALSGLTASDHWNNQVVVVGASNYASSWNTTILPLPPIIQTIHVPIDEEEWHKKHAQLGPIFYNFFVPTTPPKRTVDALRIAAEQQIERQRTAPNAPLWYTLIGHPNITHDFCQPNCHQREYLELGDEVDTYQALWKHCHRHPHDIVTYTHDRGSFHHTFANEKSRRFGTKKILDGTTISRQCQHVDGTLLVCSKISGAQNLFGFDAEHVRRNVATSQQDPDLCLSPSSGNGGKLFRIESLRPRTMDF
jgi:hypothetical protein